MGLLGQKMAVMVVVVWVAMMAAVARGQQIPSCASDLVPCWNDLNKTNPSKECCEPLRNAVNNDLSCLCALYKQPDILKAFNITVEKALQLSRRCGITSDLTACSALAPGSHSPPPPAASGVENGRRSAHRATWFGITGLTSLLFFWWSILA